MIDIVYHRLLNPIQGGKVLDAATSQGGFISTLIRHLGSYDHITGIDVNQPDTSTPESVFSRDDVSFEIMDACDMSFPDAHFDTVGISMALHHLHDVQRGLAEMRRILKPGGTFIIVEQHRDHQDSIRLNWVDFHHWFASIDRAQGISHNYTFTRTEIVDMAEELSLDNLQIAELHEATDDPLDADEIAWSERRLKAVLERARDMPHFPVIRMQGEVLLARLHSQGLQRPTRLLITGRKPA